MPLLFDPRVSPNPTATFNTNLPQSCIADRSSVAPVKCDDGPASETAAAHQPGTFVLDLVIELNRHFELIYSPDVGRLEAAQLASGFVAAVGVREHAPVDTLGLVPFGAAANGSTVPSASPRCLQEQIQKETQSMDLDSKMLKCRDVLMAPYMRTVQMRLRAVLTRLFSEQFQPLNRRGAVVDPVPASGAEGDDMLGCEHYARNCKIKASCCGLYVSCRFCHDEAMEGDHEMDRFATERVLCMVCLEEQSIGKTCVKCGVEFGHHYCKECRFMDNTPGKKVYHCDKCKICRLGEGLGEDNYHCDRCEACVSLKSKGHHRCMSKALHANCPVCRVYLFTSTEPVVFMRCGHTMHAKCFDDYTSGSYQCPLCLRSLTDMKMYFRQIDELVESQPMPPGFENKVSHILCNDCGEKSDVRYHFAYHKCDMCKSYNTKILSYSGEDAQPVAPQPVASQSVASLPGSSVTPESGLEFGLMMFPPDDRSVSQSPRVVRSIGLNDDMERVPEFSYGTGLYPHASGSLPIPGDSRQSCSAQSCGSSDSGSTLMPDWTGSPCAMAWSISSWRSISGFATSSSPLQCSFGRL